jgi:putative ABC transport system permease protein
MISNYLKIAWRNFWKNKGYSFINIIGLAMGLVCSILISLWIQNERSYDQFHKNGAQLYRVMANLNWGTESTGPYVPAPLNEILKKDLPEIKYAATISDDEILLNAGNNRFKEKGSYVTPDFLHMFSFPLLKGNASTVLNKNNGIVITERLSEKYFGHTDPIGKLIRVNNTDPFLVTGVIKDPPANSSLQFDWLISFDYYLKKNDWLNGWGNYAVTMYAELQPGSSLGETNPKLLHFLQKGKDHSETKDELFLQPFREMYLNGNFSAGKPNGGRIDYVRLFSIIAIFVLLIACINFMNLSTARSAKRAREVGIRKVMGAERRVIIMQFLGESFLLTLFSVALALVITKLILPAFSSLMDKKLVLNFADGQFVFTILLITLVTGLVSGSYPAFFLSAFKPVQVLKSVILKSGGGNRFRKGLVVFQFALSILLIIATVIISQQLNFIRHKNLGLDKEQLILVPNEGDYQNHADAYQFELLQSPGIAAVTNSGDNPLEINGTSGDLNWPGKPPKQATSISATWVGYDYLKTIGVPLVAGRDFSRTMADSNSYVINESAMRMMNMKDPVGKQVSFWSGKGSIIGVVKDFHLHSLHQSITPLILCLRPGNAAVFLVRTEKGKTAEAITSLHKLAQKYNPAYPFEYHFMDELYEKAYNSEKIVGDLIRIFAVMAIVISCLGLFGLATFTAEQRTKEIGIRKVLGASVSGITALLSKEFLMLVMIAILIASPIAWWAANSWLDGFAYHVPLSWGVFALSGLMSVVIAFTTVSFQAIKAAMSNPIKGLRSE